ncbi:hypothetical protein LTR81_027921, partial [Elasticomyces elasticus]
MSCNAQNTSPDVKRVSDGLYETRLQLTDLPTEILRKSCAHLAEIEPMEAIALGNFAKTCHKLNGLIRAFIPVEDNLHEEGVGLPHSLLTTGRLRRRPYRLESHRIRKEHVLDFELIVAGLAMPRCDALRAYEQARTLIDNDTITSVEAHMISVLGNGELESRPLEDDWRICYGRLNLLDASAHNVVFQQRYELARLHHYHEALRAQLANRTTTQLSLPRKPGWTVKRTIREYLIPGAHEAKKRKYYSRQIAGRRLWELQSVTSPGLMILAGKTLES